MSCFKNCLSLLLLLWVARAGAQDFKWSKEVAGHFWPAKKSTLPGYQVNQVFDLMNRIPVFSHPRGYDVEEWFEVSKTGGPHMMGLYFNFYYYYTYQNGAVQRLDAHPPTVVVSINNPKALMDDQQYLFSGESDALHLPVMFTEVDTFAVSYTTVNGYRAGTGINNQFGRPIRFIVLNPKGTRLFRPVTKEEYLKVFIEHYEREIRERDKDSADRRNTLEETANNPLFDQKTIDKLRKDFAAMDKFFAYERSKVAYYKKMLANMDAPERKSPARYAMYKKAPLLYDKNGNYFDTISGELMYAPLESTEDTLATRRLFTFNEKAFDPKLPKSAIQLMVIFEAHQVDDDREFKRFLDRELYPQLPLKELAALMYREP